MIKRLKFQIAFTVSLILSVLLTLILFTINVLSYSGVYTEAYEMLELVASANGETEGIIDNSSGNASIYRHTGFFSVLFSSDGDVITVKKPQDSDVTDNELVELCRGALTENNYRGDYGNYLYFVKHYNVGRIVVVMDNSANVQSIKNMRQNSVLIGCIGVLVIGWLSYALSDWLVFPVKQTLERQKQFISDAGHELKTPIAVISANAEVLEDKVGENKWLNYIKSESDRMSSLVNNLLILSRIDSADERPAFEKINMSKLVEGVTMPFECIAFEKGVLIECLPGENITVNGLEDSIKQVVAILIDNAIKYSYDNGKIIVSLKQIRGRAVLEVANTGDEISKESRARIFERFFRVDESRHRENGGYGLGLAIAKSIVESHHGSINVECLGGWTKFKVVL